MASKHHISSAKELYYGDGYDPSLYGINGRRGIQFHPLTRCLLGSPIAADTNAFIAAATSTELPNAGTKTYNTSNAGSSPCDDAGLPTATTIVTASGATASVWPLGVARNITLAVTHATSIVACSLTITGYSKYGSKMIETLSVTATGTSKTSAGKKAMAYIESFDIYSAGDATANTINVGFGDVLGLPFRLDDNGDVLKVSFGGVLDTTPTIVVADTTDPATATTGDTRGTVDPTSACDGSAVMVWMMVSDPSTPEGLRGVNQYGG